MSESALLADRGRLSRGNQIVWTRLMGATALTAALAAGVTSLIYLGARGAGLLNETVVLPSPLGMGPFSLASVSVTAFGASVAAGCVLGALALMTQRPIRNFRVLATLLALTSLSMPATIPGPPLPMRLTMAGMHIVVWAVAVAVLPAVATRAPRPVSR
jgi:hypothetical protein